MHPFIPLAVPAADGSTPIGIDLDGTNDYGSRTSDPTGNADGKEATFAFSGYRDATGAVHTVYDSNGRFTIAVNASDQIVVTGANTSGTTILSATVTSPLVPKNTFFHALGSFDLASASDRSIYVNDAAATVTWGTYTNQNIDFTSTAHGVGASGSGTNKWNGRLAGLYLAHTYRDLSDSANRRDFITADGFYVAPPTSGILSMPMDDPTDPLRNDGTGGIFTLNGTIARSGRGPNQYNPAASAFESGDSMSAAGVPGITSTGYTISFILKTDLANQALPFWVDSTGNVAFQVSVLGTGVLRIYAYDQATTTLLINIEADDALVAGRFYCIQAVVDPVTGSGNKLVVNGVEVATTTSTFVSRANHNLDGPAKIGSGVAGQEVSEVYFVDEKIDLSSSNPFYDTDTGKAKFLGVDGSLPTGSAPDAYWPLNAADPGRDASGNGNTLTVTSGPYAGARGSNEFWAHSANSDGTSYLLRSSAITGLAASKEITLAAFMKFNGTQGGITFKTTGGASTRLQVTFSGSQFEVEVTNSSGTNVLRAQINAAGAVATGEWLGFFLTADLTDSANRYAYCWGDQAFSSVSWVTYTNANMALDEAEDNRLFVSGTTVRNSAIGFLYLDDVYAGNSEATALQIVDAFGYPVDIGEDGSGFSGTAPALYMNEGIDSGADSSGNNNTFTATAGTISDAGLVRG